MKHDYMEPYRKHNYDLTSMAKEELEQTDSIDIYASFEKSRTRKWIVACLVITAFFLFFVITLFQENADLPDEEKTPLPGMLFVSSVYLLPSLIGLFYNILKLFKSDKELAIINKRRGLKSAYKLDLQRQSHFDLYENDFQPVAGFYTSKTLTFAIQNQTETKLLIDNQNKTFIYLSGKQQSRLFAFDELINYEIYENGNSIMSGRAGSALVGGALFGVVGAIAGSSMSRNISETCNQLKLIIRINDLNYPHIVVTYVENMSLSKNGASYQNMIKNLQEVCSTLEFILNNKTTSQS